MKRSNQSVTLKLSDSLEIEVEGIYYNNRYSNPPLQTDRIDYGITSVSGLVNFSHLMRELKNGLQFHVGGGVGLSYYSERSTKSTITGNVVLQDVPGWDFAWQAGLGLSKSLNNSLTLDGKLRLLSLGRFKDNTRSGRIYNLVISLGLKYTF